MASAIFCENEVLEFAAAEPTEWVRGNDADLLARFTPLVRGQSVKLDFSHVERIDAAGLSALISLYREAHEAGHSFAITNPTSHVREILAVVGLDRVLLAGSSEPRPAFAPSLSRTAA
jgi:anti-anti-sigma factor